MGKDLRQVGSKNIGATNAYRAHGPVFFVTVALIDLLKGYFAAKMLGGHYGMLAVCLGQVFPVWLKFAGGKGLGVYIGTLAAEDFARASAMCVVWILGVRLTKRPFLCSILVLALSLFIGQNDIRKFLVMCLILIRHIDNIKQFFNESRKNSMD